MARRSANDDRLRTQVAGCALLVSLVISVAIALVAWRLAGPAVSWRYGRGFEWNASVDADNLLTLLLPAVFPFIALAASIKLWIDARRGRRFSVVSSGLFFSAQAVTWALLGLLVANYQEISTDGTAFWAYLAIPAFWVGIPTVIVAFLATALAVATQRR